MPNRFYVEPGGDWSQGLQGLTQQIGQIGQQKKVEEEKSRIIDVRREAGEVFRRGDPDEIAEFSINNPEISKEMQGQVKFRNEMTKNNYVMSLFEFLKNPSQVVAISENRKAFLRTQGMTDEEMQETTNFPEMYATDPKKTVKTAEQELAFLAPDQYKTYKSATTPTIEGKTTEIKNFEYFQKLLKDDELGASKFTDMTDSEYSPSPLKKLIGERQALVDDGMALDDPTIRAYDSKISGTNVDIEEMTQDEIDTWGAYLNYTGKMPTLGRGKAVAKIRARIVKSAASQALGSKVFGEEDVEPDKTPAQAALEVIGSQSDTKAIQGSLNFLDKQLAAMGSFVANIEMQVDKVAELSKDLKTFDIRLLNWPLRTVRGKIIGSSLQAKYDMYLTEIEGEIGKLATGSSGSIAELSATAQEKWAKIHDKNLSVKDMLSLLEETKNAAKMREKSVKIQLDLARKRMRTRGIVLPAGLTEDSGGKFKEGQIATGAGGKKIIFRNGAWEDM
jgi:flagellin-like hook-associated protein FlgL